MSREAAAPRTRAEFRAASGVLLVMRDPPPPAAPTPGQPASVPAHPAEGAEVLLAVWCSGRITALHGHVDLGTGLATALAQIVAEELDADLAQVSVVLGHTASVPNQGPTIASASIQVHGVPLRAAAAMARAWLADAGWAPGRSDVLAALLQGRHVELMLPGDASTVPVKPVAEHRIVGTNAPRIDIPAKAFGELTFVHDMRVPGMLHGRVVRPPYAGVDVGEFIGNTLDAVDESSIAHLPGIRAVVTIRDFVGIVAEREEHAEAAMRELRVTWKAWPGIKSLHDTANALSAHPATRRVLLDTGGVDAALANATQPMPRTYVWPYQLHASIGPSCALADWREGAMTVWAGTQNPHGLRADLALLMGLDDTAIDVVRMEAAGCYGRNCADDVAADAALLSRAVGSPVRVQLSREQEHLWEPKGAAQLMQVNGGLDAHGAPAAYDFQTSYPSNGAPTLALLLTRTVQPSATAFEMGDRTAVPPYAYQAMRIVANDMAPILRASWLRGVSALPNSFAHESYIDELATAAGVDPVAYRLRYLKDERASQLVQATAARAGWLAHTQPQQQAPAVGRDGNWRRGQGFAYARYVHSKFPGFGAAWAAWVADVEVNAITGEVHVSRVVVGQDAGLMVNPAGVQHQVHGNVLQTTSRALRERVPLDAATSLPVAREWGSYPLLSFREVPVVEVMLMPRPGELPLGVGESSSVPGTAAIANAIFDATGVRFREPPFLPEVVRAGLGDRGASRSPSPPPSPQRGEGGMQAARLHKVAVARAPRPSGERAGVRGVPITAPLTRKRSLLSRSIALAAATLGLTAAALGWRAAIAPVAASSINLYTPATLERGRILAALGNCTVCHTAPHGIPNAGGRALATPFGTVYSTNLTPDAATGIGAWSFSAFQRAMREGVSRDGRHLYPAFPYTAYTQTTDDDLTALYAHLMSLPPVGSAVPETRLAFPFNLRPLMALWNALYLTPGPVAAVATHTAEWNRGAYLVTSLGHCGACHTPRDALGAEKPGSATLNGTMVDGWEAPALTSLSHAPVPWSADELYRYLRSGHTLHHGAVAGPMAPVVQQLQAVPDADVRAMATYLASFNPPDAARGEAARAAAVVAPSTAASTTRLDESQRLFDAACGACHHAGDGPEVFGLNLPLALSSKLHSERPDNLLNVIINGIREPATRDIGFMPAFRDALDDAQVAQLVSHLRLRYAPDKPAWPDLPASVARARATQALH